MTFDFERLDPREGYRLLVSTVVPRPIALVTTLSKQGGVNAAPFSFFNVVGSDPPVVVLGIESGEGGFVKDTARNIRESREFVVNLVTEKIADRMSICAVDFAAGVDELEESGLTAAPASSVKVPRILESPVSLECREMMTIALGPGNSLVVGNVVAMQIDDDFYQREARRVRTAEMALVGRMHGSDWYTRTSDLFRMKLPEQPER